MKALDNRTIAEKVRLVLEYLKDHKVSQKMISNKINYTSLSKIKDPEKYPQSVIERKTRQEVLELLLQHYGLEIDMQTDKVWSTSATFEPVYAETLHYIMYYYSFFRKEVAMAWIRIIDRESVLIDYRIDEHWKGKFEVIENYTFIHAEKQGITTPVKKLICLFSGTVKYGRPILLGTYSTVKRDGYPAAGKTLLEKIDDKEEALTRFASKVDPRIEKYLNRSVFTTETFTPNALEDLGKI
jgi:hypothetical protein